MKCKVCKEKLILREGKFGPFWACVNSTSSDNHGTVSVKPEKFVDTISKKELKRLKKNRDKLLKKLHGKNNIGIRKITPYTPDFDLEKEVNLAMARDFGYLVSDHDIFMDCDYDEPGHWSNCGLY